MATKNSTKEIFDKIWYIQNFINVCIFLFHRNKIIILPAVLNGQVLFHSPSGNCRAHHCRAEQDEDTGATSLAASHTGSPQFPSDGTQLYCSTIKKETLYLKTVF